MTQPGTYIASARPLSVFIGRCEPCNRPVRATTDLYSGDHYPVACPDCHKFRDAQRLYGTISKMECHGACMGAYGKTCDCACGGINHGDIWSRPGEMLADALAIYRADRERRIKAAEKAKRTRENRKEHIRAAAWEAWRSEHADLITELIATNWLICEYPNNTLADFADMVGMRCELLSDAQTALAERILARRREVREQIAAEQAEREARDAERPEQTEVPTGRQFIEGPIIAAWTFDGDFGIVWKIKVDCGTFHVRGTLPRALESEALPQPYSGEDYRNLKHTLPGRYVKLKATLEPDGKETGQGYFRRPSNAEFVRLQANI